MTLRRGQALVASVPRVVQLTGATDLRNLEASGELRLDDLLVSASDAVHDRLVAEGVVPDSLLNPEVYERAVAYRFLAALAAQGFLQGKEEPEVVSTRYLALADRAYEEVRPRFKAGDQPALGLPVVRNVAPAWFGGWS